MLKCTVAPFFKIQKCESVAHAQEKFYCARATDVHIFLRLLQCRYNPKVEANRYWESEGRRQRSLWTILTDIIREVGQLD